MGKNENVPLNLEQVSDKQPSITVEGLREFCVEHNAAAAARASVVAVAHVLDEQTVDAPFEDRQYQKDFADAIINDLFQRQDVAGIEVYCGGGKTRISAMVMAHFIQKNPHARVVFISPNRASFEHFANEIKREFKAIGLPVLVDSDKDGFHLDCRIHIKNHFSFVREYEAFEESNSDVKFPIETVLDETLLYVVDEAHRYPEEEDEKEASKIIGRVHDIIAMQLQLPGRKALAMTATHDRMDGQLPFGIEEPDMRYTMNELIQNGYAPNLRGYCVPVKLHKSVNVKTLGDDFVFDNGSKKVNRHIDAYYDGIVDIIAKIYQNDVGFGHCIFVSRQNDAERLAEKLNKRFKQIGKEFALIISNSTSVEERQDIIREMKKPDSRFVGYVTCNVGAESIDIPRLKYCHLVARTKSIVRLMQMVGRVSRRYNGKEDCVVVDYRVMKHKIVKSALGIKDIAARNGLDWEKIKNGGHLAKGGVNGAGQGVDGNGELPEDDGKFVDGKEKAGDKFGKNGSNKSKPPMVGTPTLGEIEDWLMRVTYEPSSADFKKEKLLEMARNGEARPSAMAKDEEERKLGAVLVKYTNACDCYDIDFNFKIRAIAPAWFADSTIETKMDILQLAREGGKRPNMHSKNPLERKNARALQRYTSKGSSCYDSNFNDELRAIASDWFLDSAQERKKILLQRASVGQSRPVSKSKDINEARLAVALSSYTNIGNPCYDKSFDRKIRSVARSWFIDSVHETKKKLLFRARHGHNKPLWGNDVKENRMAGALNRFTSKKSREYDPDFTQKIYTLAPQWFVDTAKILQDKLLYMANNGQKKPSPSSKKQDEKKMWQALWRYTSDKSRGYDPDFDAQIRAIAPSWFSAKKSANECSKRKAA